MWIISITLPADNTGGCTQTSKRTSMKNSTQRFREDTVLHTLAFPQLQYDTHNHQQTQFRCRSWISLNGTLTRNTDAGMWTQLWGNAERKDNRKLATTKAAAWGSSADTVSGLAPSRYTGKRKRQTRQGRRMPHSSVSTPQMQIQVQCRS